MNRPYFKIVGNACSLVMFFYAFAVNADTLLRDDFDSLSLDESTNGSEQWVGRWVRWNVNALAGNSDDYFKMWDSLSYNNGPTVATSLQRAGWGNSPFLHEASGGTLKLRAYPAPADLQSSIWNYPYVGSMISTEQSLTMNEGFFEIRYRNKTIDKGTHVSLWLLDINGDHPPEIDIFETLSEDVNGSQHFFAYNAHGAPSGPTFVVGDSFGGDQNFEFLSESEFTSWQTFRFEWNERELIWLRNGNVVRRQANYLNDRQMYFLLTMEGANVWTGDPDGSTRWPQEAEVDYIEIGQGASSTPPTVPTPTTPTPTLGIDEIEIQSAPDTIKPTGSYTVSLAYNVDETRDISVNLLSIGPWESFGASTVTVGPGSGVQTFEVNIDGPLPDRNYVWEGELKPEGGSWENALFEQFVDVIVDEDTQVALKILEIQANPSNTDATIEWAFNDFATGYVEYGKTTAYGNETTRETSFNYKLHQQTISNLEPNSLYHFRIHGRDAQGNEVTSADNVVTTTDAGVPVITVTPVIPVIPVTPTPSACSAPTGIKHQFRGEDGVESWPGSLNLTTPEAAHTRETITSPTHLVPYGTASMKTEIKSGDPQWGNDETTASQKRRAEYSWSDWRFSYDNEAWAGAAFYLPSDPMLKNKGTSFFQLHNYPEAGVMLHVSTWDGELRISSDAFGGAILNTDLRPYLDTWTRIVINFKPTTRSDGYLKIWLDDILVVDKTGQTKTSGSQGPYFKHGAYFWGYEKFDPIKHAVVYHDNLRIADETGSYESVDPKCW